MAKYYYEQYTVVQLYDEVFSHTHYWSSGIIQTIGHSDYSFDRQTGKFSVYGDQIAITVNADYGWNITQNKQHICSWAYFAEADGSKLESVSGYRSNILKGQIYIPKLKNYSGSLLGTVIAEDGTYPENGISGNYWYVRTNQLAESATITNPAGGEMINTNHLIQWTKTTNDVNVDIELYTGTIWKSIGTNIIGNSLNYNFQNEAETPSAKLRVRVRTPDSNPAYSDWTESAIFTIKHQLSETATITSPNGGETINEDFLITWTKDSNVNVDIELSLNNGQTWKRIITDQSGISVNYNFQNETETSTARLRIRATKDGLHGNWKINNGVFTIQHDYAPLAPTQLSPNGTVVSRAVITRLSWNHNHPGAQSKFDLRWSEDQSTWNDITRTTTNQYYDAAEEFFPEGDIYWQVRTYSDAGMISPWSSVAVFVSAEPSDAPIITSSSNISIARPTFTWSQVDQAEYQVQILDSIGQIKWDTGTVVSGNKAVTCGIDLLNNSTYKLRVRTKTAAGLWTNYTEQTLTVSYTPPAVPEIILIEGAYDIYILIDNPTPTGTQPNVSYNDVYRDNVRIATNIQSGYRDLTPDSGIEHAYHVVAVGENESMSESLYHFGTINIEYAVLTTLEGDTLELDTELQTIEKMRYDGYKLKFAGRPKPVAQFGEHEEGILDFVGLIYREDDINKFRQLVDRRNTILFRDYKGRKMFGIIFSHEIFDIEMEKTWYQIAFRLEEVDYQEGV